MRVCLHPECPELTDNTRCDQHRREFQRSQRSKYRRNTYSWDWPKVSKRFRKKNPICQCDDAHCLCGGHCTLPSAEVDHIIAIVHFGDNHTAANADENLKALCSPCHKSKTMRFDYPGRS